MGKIQDAKLILKEIGMPESQQSDLCAYTLIALSCIKENQKWSKSTNKYVRIHDIIEFLKENYSIIYAENSRETIRKQALHHFVISALVEDNNKPTNSPNYMYRITDEAYSLIQSYGTSKWKSNLRIYNKNHEQLIKIYENKKQLTKIPLEVNGIKYNLSTGKHNILQKAIIEVFASRFARGSKVLYVGDTKDKDLYKDRETLKKVGINIGEHEKLPDVVLYQESNNWIYFVEAVCSVGPMSPKRIVELKEIIQKCKCGVIYVTAFWDMKTFKKFAEQLAWDTEVWIADMPEHMIHLNGDRFMGPR